MSPMFSQESARRPFIKVCGVCNLADANICAESGVNAIGILLAKPDGPRRPHSDRMDPVEAAALVTALPLGLHSVLLVHSLNLDVVEAVDERIAPTALQVQAPIPPEDLRKFKNHQPDRVIIKSFSIDPGMSPQLLSDEIRVYLDHGSIDAVLLDSPHGGSGVVHDWSISAAVVRAFAETPVLIAGGLRAENVGAALATVRPYGIDVMTGVNSLTRDRKDPERLRAFVLAARTEVRS